MNNIRTVVIWLTVALIGAFAFAMLALSGVNMSMPSG